MKKIKIFALIVLCITVFSTFASCAKSDAPEGYQLVACEGDKFRLYVPTQWTSNTSNGVTGAFYSTGQNISVSVHVADDAADMSVEEYWAKCRAEYEKSMKDFSFVSESNSKLDQQPARKYVYTASVKVSGDDAVKYQFMQVMAKYKGEMYILLFTCPQDKYEERVKDLEGEGNDLGIIDYFRFAEPYVSEDKKEISDKVTPPEGMKLASTEKVPYRFYVPEVWKINDRTESAAAYYSDSDSSNVHVQMYMMGDDSPATVADYFAYCESKYKEIFESYSLESTTDIKMDGIAAKQYIYDVTEGGVVYKQLQAIVKKGEVYYTVTYTATADKFDSHIEDVKKMIEKFDIR